MAFNRLYDNFSGQGSNKGIMGDFAHAAALYRRNNFRLAPKIKFLYHVVIDVNTTALSTLGRSVTGLLNQREFNLLASAASLPTFTMNTETLNQYNRKKVIQTKLNYNPIDIEFHDDNAGLTTLLWESYYRYYYQDGNYDNEGGRPRAYYTKLYDTDNANTYRHGFNRRRTTDVPFFNSITIHQLHPQDIESTFTSFTLVNPLISEWQHDRVDQSDGSGTMRNTMRIDYESMFYDRGETTDNNIALYSDISHYDTVDSPYSNTTSNGVGERTGNIGFWAQVFTDLLSNPISLTDFNTQQNQSSLPINYQIYPQINNQSFTNTNYFPSSEKNNTFTSAQPLNTRLDDLSLSDQEFKRQLQSNPQKLADYAAGEAQLQIAVFSGLSIQESKDFYNNLSPNVKAQVEQSALNNFNELEKGVVGNSTGFQNDLKEIGLIG
jgi:hypothetical protein